MIRPTPHGNHRVGPSKDLDSACEIKTLLFRHQRRGRRRTGLVTTASRRWPSGHRRASRQSFGYVRLAVRPDRRQQDTGTNLDRMRFASGAKRKSNRRDNSSVPSAFDEVTLAPTAFFPRPCHSFAAHPAGVARTARKIVGFNARSRSLGVTSAKERESAQVDEVGDAFRSACIKLFSGTAESPERSRLREWIPLHRPAPECALALRSMKNR